MIINILKSFGLCPKEMKVFEKLLDLGAQPASHIARVLELPRNTVRSILDNLVKKNLLVKTNRANTQYYSVESKKNILRQLKHKKLKLTEEIDEQIELLENYADEFDSKHKSKTRPKITFYEGMDGLEKVYEDTLTAKDGIKSWASFEGMHGALPDYFKSYYDRRAKKKIMIQSIHPDSDFSRERQARDEKELRESRLVPSDQFQWRPEIQVYNNKVNIASWKEKLGIIIESEEIAESILAIFNMSWIGAGCLNEEVKDKKKKK